MSDDHSNVYDFPVPIETIRQGIEGLKAEQTHTTERLVEIERKLEELTEIITLARGGLRALAIVGGVAATVSGLCVAAYNMLRHP